MTASPKAQLLAGNDCSPYGFLRRWLAYDALLPAGRHSDRC